MLASRTHSLAGKTFAAAVAAVGLGWLVLGLGSQGHAPIGHDALFSARPWLNRTLRPADLKGKVVLVNFWTYTCINSLRPLPYVRAWASKYKDRGLVVIGVHTPEFSFERDLGNVRAAVAAQGIEYPVVLDSDYAIWRSFGNNAWPAFYFIGADGKVRSQKLGEGDYDASERLIQTLLAEAGQGHASAAVVPVAGVGAQAAPDWRDLGSPETYVGYAKASGLSSPTGLSADATATYPAAPKLRLNQWSLSGAWRVEAEAAVVERAGGAITFRFHARDLNLVLAPPSDGRTARFRVRIDDAEPGADHGADTDAQGVGQVRAARLYQLVRQSRVVADRTFEIDFLDPGARAYVFTFG